MFKIYVLLKIIIKLHYLMENDERGEFCIQFLIDMLDFMLVSYFLGNKF